MIICQCCLYNLAQRKPEKHILNNFKSDTFQSQNSILMFLHFFLTIQLKYTKNNEKQKPNKSTCGEEFRCWHTWIKPRWFGFGFGSAWRCRAMLVMGIHYSRSRSSAAAHTLPTQLFGEDGRPYERHKEMRYTARSKHKQKPQPRRQRYQNIDLFWTFMDTSCTFSTLSFLWQRNDTYTILKSLFKEEKNIFIKNRCDLWCFFCFSLLPVKNRKVTSFDVFIFFNIFAFIFTPWYQKWSRITISCRIKGRNSSIEGSIFCICLFVPIKTTYSAKPWTIKTCNIYFRSNIFHLFRQLRHKIEETWTTRTISP